MKQQRILRQLKEHSTYECAELLGKGQFAHPTGVRKTKNSSNVTRHTRIGKDFQATLPAFGELSQDRRDERLSGP
jgi:hypothetical protein